MFERNSGLVPLFIFVTLKMGYDEYNTRFSY